MYPCWQQDNEKPSTAELFCDCKNNRNTPVQKLRTKNKNFFPLRYSQNVLPPFGWQDRLRTFSRRAFKKAKPVATRKQRRDMQVLPICSPPGTRNATPSQPPGVEIFPVRVFLLGQHVDSTGRLRRLDGRVQKCSRSPLLHVHHDSTRHDHATFAPVLGDLCTLSTMPLTLGRVMTIDRALV